MTHDQVTQISSTVAGEVESDKYNFNKGRSEIIEVKKKLIGNNIMLNGVVLELGWSISKGAKAQIKSEINMEESKEADKDRCKNKKRVLQRERVTKWDIHETRGQMPI